MGSLRLRVCAQGVNSGFCALPVVCAELCVQDVLVQRGTGIGPVYTFPSPSLPPAPAASSFCLCASLLSLSRPCELLPVPVPSPAFLPASPGLGWEAQGPLNPVRSELDSSTPASRGRRVELGALLRGRKKAVAYRPVLRTTGRAQSLGTQWPQSPLTWWDLMAKARSWALGQ